MKKIITILSSFILVFAFATTAMADTETVVSDTSVQIVGVYNKAGGPTNYVDLSSSPLNAVRAQEPKPYPTGYVSEGAEVTNSVWDTGVNWSFQTNAPTADWIWETERAEGPASYDVSNPLYDVAASTNGRVVVFEKDFNISGIPSGGTLRIAADNGWEVWVNGTFLARSSTATPGWELSNLHQTYLNTTGWQNVGNIAIPAVNLQNGQNIITILAGNEYFASDDGNSPTPPLRLSPYYQYNPGALIFKADINYTPVSPLEVTKTAETSYDRAWEWTINKTANVSEITLATGQKFYVNYSIAVDRTNTDSNWAVEGTITIHNPNTVDATIENVSDMVSPDVAGTVDCGVTFPYTLVAGGNDLVCTYDADLPDASQRTNTAEVTTSGDVPGNSDTEDVIFGYPTNETDECVDVADTLKGTLGNTCQDHTYAYQSLVDGYEACGEYTVENIASFTSNNTSLTGSDDHTINIHVPCIGCTLTQGYWKTHSSEGPAPFDDTWVDQEDNILQGMTWYNIFWTSPKKGNAWYILAHQYIAAKLNQLNGASITLEVQNALIDTANKLNNNSPASIESLKGNNALRQEFINLAGVLGNYNEGLIGPGHCDEQGMLTGKWLLGVNNNTYMHDMYIIEGSGGALTGFGGYVAGNNPYLWPYNWTMTGQLTGGNTISMTITYQNGYVAAITGTVALDWNSMSGGAGTGGVVNWTATRVP